MTFISNSSGNSAPNILAETKGLSLSFAITHYGQNSVRDAFIKAIENPLAVLALKMIGCLP